MQLVLIIPFVLQVFGIVSLVGYLSFRNGQKAVNDLANQLIDRNSDLVDQHLNAYLSIPQKLTEINANAIQLGLLDVGDRETAGKYFWQQMQAYNLTFIGYGLTTGAGVGAISYDGKTTVVDDWGPKLPNNDRTYAINAQGDRTHIIRTYDYNHLTESWYRGPLDANKPTWSDIYVWDSPYGPYIAASAGRPIYDSQHRIMGVVDADIHLLKLSDFLRQLEVSRSGQVFIMERNGMLIANSSTQQPFSIVNGKLQRLQAIESPNSEVQSIAKQVQQTFNGFQSITESQRLEVNWQGNRYFVHVTPWRDAYGLDWLVVVSVPEHAFMAQIDANTRTTVLLCLGALAIACLLGILTARLIVRPILRLNQASKAMASGNLEQFAVSSGIRELNGLANSFNHMAGQIRESFLALEDSNEQLEARVEQRTVELQDALTELRRTQAQVIQSEKMSSLGQLVAGVAHEINNPVNFIHGNLSHAQEYTQQLLEFVQLCKQHYPNPKVEIQEAATDIDLEFLQDDLPKVLSSMQVGTNRIRQIVLSLRNFSRMDEAEIKPVDIHEGLNSTLLILQHRLKAKQERPEIEVVKDYDRLPPVECYAGQLNQVFMNVLTNAIDALEESFAGRTFQDIQANPGRLTIRTSAIGKQWVQIAIADNGPGIPPAIQQQVFNPFFTTKPVGKGTGMGMSISYQIITEKHGGKLDCFSRMGEGTEFVIQIPIAPSNQNGQ